MRKPLLAALVAAPILLLAACDLSQTMALFKLKFSSNGFDGPTINGPTLLEAGKLMLPKTMVGGYNIGGEGLTKEQVLAQYSLGMVFKVKADNSGNTDKASFGTTYAKPSLDFHLMTRDSKAISVAFEPFSVDGGKVGDLTFPISIPVSDVGLDLAKKVIAGDSIPYFLTGKLAFNLLGLNGATNSTDQLEVDLASDKVPTRPADGSGLSVSDLGALVSKLF